MGVWITVVLVIALLLIVKYMPAITKPAKSRPENGKYHGVEVKYDERHCCKWVKKLDGARLLPHQARLFPLPLPECDAANCTCRYVHFEDRRHDDRRIPFSPLYTAFGRTMAQERRAGRERRRGYVSEEVRIISEAHLDNEVGYDSGGRPSL